MIYIQIAEVRAILMEEKNWHQTCIDLSNFIGVVASSPLDDIADGKTTK